MISEEIFDSGSTICAVSTPHGAGGIAVVRVSGPDSLKIVEGIWRGKQLEKADSHTAHFGAIVDPERPEEVLDECVATVFKGPRSFTGEDTVEISVHGSLWIQRELVALLVRQGCRPALAGEYTRRALVNGKLDLVQAEAVADVIASSSRASHRLAASQLKGQFSKRLGMLRENLLELASLLELELDFSEEDVEFADRSRLRSLAENVETEIGRLHDSYASGLVIKDGIPVAITGATNAGKSSLLNRLLSEDRAIVSDIHGTTRDTIEETLEVGDYLFRFIDTAGLRDTDDPIEKLGIERSREAIDRARIVITVVDPTSEAPFDSLARMVVPEDVAHIVMINKCDVWDGDLAVPSTRAYVIRGAARTGHGMDRLLEALKEEVVKMCPEESEMEGVIITNARHASSLGEARKEASAILAGLDNHLPPEFIAQHLREIINHLSSITGAISTPEILQTIFAKFCIGK
ncbi:MAG: tRNA uridine-5-carboxymethylaminomethyl(34) synthesis GTPase MnmE [Muribaculaceae bacterium]|nr:tRNA uridine-5-carboxymethylaminomethyl(34) synthesis GTPase MnmE [Muribaculaceae bacterium]